ncbi:FAD-binding protein [Aquibium sp. LZ166]|uniref:FAD-binding protein n=1 Tax=Aquibium pacificus TaxID=3153579 RepID=A0ABV3SM00_9HYPH
MAAALAAANLGMRALLLEKAHLVGGGTTDSYGLIWVGGNHLAEAAGLRDNRDDILAYMRFVAGGESQAAKLEAYVDQSPGALRFFEQCGVEFQLTRGVADHYMGIAPGARSEGRTVEAKLISGYELGEWRERVRRPAMQPFFLTAEEQVAWGGMNTMHSWNQDLVTDRRQKDMRGKGVGLISQFLRGLLAADVPILTNVDTRSLINDGNRVAGVELADGRRIKASRGVVLAAGGYESNLELVQTFEGMPGWTSQCPESNCGDGLVLAGEIGGAIHLIRNNLQLFLGFEVPVEDAPGGKEFHLAGIVELCSPHTMVVNRFGMRFADESYFQGMVPALRRFDVETHSHANLPCFLLFDSEYAENYSFGGSPAGRIPQWVASSETLDGLAAHLGIDPEGLAQTASRFADFAEAGVDEDFHRGEKAWRLAKMGGNLRNPTMGSLSKAPFYGIELRPTGAGSAGLLTDDRAQVLNVRGNAISGLYATGNTAARTEFGTGYQAGFTLASGMTFGWLAAQHMRAHRP